MSQPQSPGIRDQAGPPDSVSEKLLAELINGQPSAAGFEHVRRMTADQRQLFGEAIRDGAVLLAEHVEATAIHSVVTRADRGAAEETLVAYLTDGKLQVDCARIALTAAQSTTGDPAQSDRVLAIARLGYGTLLTAWAGGLAPIATALCGDNYEVGISALEAAVNRVYAPGQARDAMLRGVRATMLRQVRPAAVPPGLGLTGRDFQAVQGLRNQAAEEILRPPVDITRATSRQSVAWEAGLSELLEGLLGRARWSDSSLSDQLTRARWQALRGARSSDPSLSPRERDRDRHRRVEHPEVVLDGCDHEDAADHTAAIDARTRVAAVLERAHAVLSPRELSVWRAQKVEGRTEGAVAKDLGIRPQSVQEFMRRADRKLRADPKFMALGE